jgi:hypothetical protein
MLLLAPSTISARDLLPLCKINYTTFTVIVSRYQVDSDIHFFALK